MKVSLTRVICYGLMACLVSGPAAKAQSTSTNIIRGSIDVPGERDVYTFNLANRARYYFDAITNVSSITWSLESATGLLVDNRAFGSSDAGVRQFSSSNPVSID